MTTQEHQGIATQPRGMSRGLTLLFAIAGGLSVGNMYWAQPLLAPIAQDMGVASSDAGLVITLTQIGYAVGVFLIVPLGDTMNRKRIVPLIMLGAGVALAAAAAAPGFTILLVAIALMGSLSITGQILTPLAGDLASDAQRGRVLGTVASGLMLGIILARGLGGLVADVLGWRAVFIGAAALTLLLAGALSQRLPRVDSQKAQPYGHLLMGVLRTVRGDRRVRVTILLGAAPMSVFTMFWTGLTLLLSSAPFSYSTGTIGLISLIGVLGAVAALQAGRLFDRGLSVQALGAAMLVALVALVVGGIGRTSIVAIIITIALFSIGSQAALVIAQTRMMSINPAARSRMNTVYVVGNFIAGAIGSALAGLLWALGGWTAVMTVGAVILIAGLSLWTFQRTRALAH
ncbi:MULTISPECIES: MFS transporter [unclassified Arthrobacter]|uniref:MFS transporter n=1 Tax=unclassified Arthrobacter TaxID=235627 RepID=UPI002882D752|nr:MULTISPECIES: MFS transporter [unclassified Arthrobacter]